jgi:hypothetical protein
MGYYTHFKLEEPKPIPLEILVFITSYKEDNFCYGIISEEEVTWYEWKKDMVILSKAFPNIKFKLVGEGENAGDIWHAYFKNGKVQVCRAKIVFDGFDENKLVDIKKENTEACEDCWEIPDRYESKG